MKQPRSKTVKCILLSDEERILDPYSAKTDMQVRHKQSLHEWMVVRRRLLGVQLHLLTSKLHFMLLSLFYALEESHTFNYLFSPVAEEKKAASNSIVTCQMTTRLASSFLVRVQKGSTVH